MAEQQKTAAPTTIEQLLGTEAREPKTALVRFRDHPTADGSPLTFRIRELSYNQVAEIKRSTADSALRTVLMGVAAPSFKELAESLNLPTPFDAIKRILSAGEIDELQVEIEKLSGFRRKLSEVVEDIEKN